jgi:hypothetical protein
MLNPSLALCHGRQDRRFVLRLWFLTSLLDLFGLNRWWPRFGRGDRRHETSAPSPSRNLWVDLPMGHCHGCEFG